MSGATLSKGINRAIGTVLGGGLGCLAAILSNKFGGIHNAIVVGTSVFIIGKNTIPTIALDHISKILAILLISYSTMNFSFSISVLPFPFLANIVY